MNASQDKIARVRDIYWEKAQEELGRIDENCILFDKSPLSIVDLGFIARVFPNASVLVAIRDPRDACLSSYMQGFALNPAMINFLGMDSTITFYTQVMGLWLDYREALPIRWHQYRYEDLVDDFDSTARMMFHFLGLEYPEDASDFYLTARNKQITTPSYQDVTKPVYDRSKDRWKNYQKYLAPYMGQLAPFIKEFGY